ELASEHIDAITRLFADFEQNEQSLILNNAAFGYHRIVIERPLKRRFVLNNAALDALAIDKSFLKLASDERDKIVAALKASALDAPAADDEATFASTIKETIDG